MRHNRVTGQAAESGINDLRVNPVDITASVVHDTSGVRRRERRRMTWLADKLKRSPGGAQALAEFQAEHG